MKTKDRNNIILRADLNGYTPGQVGKVYNITGERVKQIAVKTVKRHSKIVYQLITARHITGSIREARRFKNRLKSIMDQESFNQA